MSFKTNMGNTLPVKVDYTTPRHVVYMIPVVIAIKTTGRYRSGQL